MKVPDLLLGLSVLASEILNSQAATFREGKEPAKMANDVELPPTVSNLGYLMEEDELYKDGPLKVNNKNPKTFLEGNYFRVSWLKWLGPPEAATRPSG